MARTALNPALTAAYFALQGFIEPRLRALGLGFQGFQVIASVQMFKGKATQGQVAESLGVTPGTLSEAVRTLVKHGLIEQRQRPTDKRAKLLLLTPDGLRTAEELRRIAWEAERTMAKGLDDRAGAQLVGLLDWVRENLEHAQRRTD